MARSKISPSKAASILNFNIRGNEVANLKNHGPIHTPQRGLWLSGKLTDPAPKKYKLSDLKLKLGKNNINGSLDLNLNGKKLHLATDLAAPKFTLQPVTLRPWKHSPALRISAR